MSDDNEMVCGSGNVFRDLGLPDAGREQLRAVLGAKIGGVPDEQRLTVRAAQRLTCVAAADYSRVRNANLGRFTIDRLMMILSGFWPGGGGVDRCLSSPVRRAGRGAGVRLRALGAVALAASDPWLGAGGGKERGKPR